LFNVAVIARDPAYLPYISAALTTDAVAAHYAAYLKTDRALAVDRYEIPGARAVNFVVGSSLDGGMMAGRRLDPAAKSYGQMLLDKTIQVPAALADKLKRK
jgi:hypothetical protein